MGCGRCLFAFASYSQVVIHDGDVQADVVHAVGGDVEDDGLVVGGVQSVLLDGRLLLLQALAVADQRHLDVRIWGGREKQGQVQPIEFV